MTRELDDDDDEPSVPSPSTEFGRTDRVDDDEDDRDEDADDGDADVDVDVDADDLLDDLEEASEDLEEASEDYQVFRGDAPPADAAWAPTATHAFRRLRLADPSMNIDVVFPTVYEENRSETIRDTLTAEAAGHITHQRAAELVAKELGIEQYDYEEEQRAITAERAARGGPLGIGSGDALARTLGAEEVPARRPARQDLTHAAVRRFRRQQKEVRALAEAVSHLARAQEPHPVRYERDAHGAIIRSVPEEPVPMRETASEPEAEAVPRYGYAGPGPCPRCGRWLNCYCEPA